MAPFEDVFPIETGDIPASYVSLPEGIPDIPTWYSPTSDLVFPTEPRYAAPLVRKSFITPRSTLAQIEKDTPSLGGERWPLVFSRKLTGLNTGEYMEWYCWWFRNPIPNHLGGCFPKPVNNGDILPTSLNWWVYSVSEPSTLSLVHFAGSKWLF